MKGQSVFVVILVVCGTFTGVFGAQWYSEAPENPSYPNQCYDAVTGDYHAVGESWRRPSKCEGLSCGGDSKGVMTITGTTCPHPTKLPSNCHMTPEKKDAAFPDCCRTLECDGEPNGPVAMNG